MNRLVLEIVRGDEKVAIQESKRFIRAPQSLDRILSGTPSGEEIFFFQTGAYDLFLGQAKPVDCEEIVHELETSAHHFVLFTPDNLFQGAHGSLAFGLGPRIGRPGPLAGNLVLRKLDEVGQLFLGKAATRVCQAIETVNHGPAQHFRRSLVSKVSLVYMSEMLLEFGRETDELGCG